MRNHVSDLRQVAEHQIRHTLHDLEFNGAVVTDFDYDEETDFEVEPTQENPAPPSCTTVTLELTYLLPE